LLDAIRNGPQLKKTKPVAGDSGDAGGDGGGDAGGDVSGGGGSKNAGGNEYGDGEHVWGDCQSGDTVAQHTVLLQSCSHFVVWYCCAMSGQLLTESGRISRRQRI
jgi:hypothetical protein